MFLIISIIVLLIAFFILARYSPLADCNNQSDDHIVEWEGRNWSCGELMAVNTTTDST